MKNTKFINFFGGPGTGKSTAAAALYVEMKKQGLDVELVTEFAKDLVWEERAKTLQIQPYITIKQYRNLMRVKDKVDYVITDAPMIMGIAYAKMYASDLPNSYETCIADLNTKFITPSYNVYLVRKFTYNPIGRYQDEMGAKEIDKLILQVLQDYGIEYHINTADQTSEILNHIVNQNTF